jgi:uncharacterized Zn finger protein (UPF0148 family)
MVDAPVSLSKVEQRLKRVSSFGGARPFLEVVKQYGMLENRLRSGSMNSAKCPSCGRDNHPFDVLCPNCGATLISTPSVEQLTQAERLAHIRSNLASAVNDQQSLESPWRDLTKSVMPVIVTLIVAIGGWRITYTYNAAQVQAQKAQQAASRASSEATASLAYLQFVAREPAPSTAQRDQALMAVAAILPPEPSFDLAAKRLPHERGPLNLLLRIYGDQSWRYLSTFLEDPSTAQPVLEVLYQGNILDHEFNWLIF